MATTITVMYGKKTYKLGYNRESICEMEREGFDFTKASQRELGSTLTLVEYAFRTYQPDISSDEIFEVWGHLKKGGKDGNIYEILIQMFGEPLNVLADPSDDSNEGNAVWKVNK